jgi:hypothetical protein
MNLTCIRHKNLMEAFFPNNSSLHCFSTHGLDEYTFLHLLVGVGAKILFPKISIIILLAMHIFWEYFETTSIMKNVFRSNKFLNGGTSTYYGDSIINSATDNIAFLIGIFLQKSLQWNIKQFLVVFIISNFIVMYFSSKRFDKNNFTYALNNQNTVEDHF